MMRRNPTVFAAATLMLGATMTPAAAANPPWHAIAPGAGRHSPFATRVIDYSPAPGQFTNDPLYNDPQRALGAPIGGGTIAPDNFKLVTLGGFGGSIILGFDQTIWDDADHPMGLDFIVFGNASWLIGLPSIRWAEAAVVEVSYDANHNGLADDPWFVIPGSHLTDPKRQRRDGYFILPDEPFGHPPIFNTSTDGSEAFWGYADMNPTLLLGDLNADNIIDDPNLGPEDFYTVPDDPRIEGITPGSGGGDGFDIAWAVDPLTGQSAHLRGIDFVRITTAVDAQNGPFGEVSAEVGSVAAVR